MPGSAVKAWLPQLRRAGITGCPLKTGHDNRNPPPAASDSPGFMSPDKKGEFPHRLPRGDSVRCQWNSQQDEAFVCHVTLLRNEVQAHNAIKRGPLQDALRGRRPEMFGPALDCVILLPVR